MSQGQVQARPPLASPPSPPPRTNQTIIVTRVNQPPSPIQPIAHQPGAALIQTSPSSFTPVIPFVTQRPVSEGLAGWLTPRPCTHTLAREAPRPAGSPARRVSHRPTSLLIGHQQGVKWMRLGLVSPRYVQCGRGAYVRSFGPRCVALSRHRTRHDDDGPSARGHGGS